MKIAVHGLGPKCHKCLWGHLCNSKKHGRHCPMKFEHPLDKVNEANRNETWWACLKEIGGGGGGGVERKNTAVQFSGLTISIMIKNMLISTLWEAITGCFRKGACPNIPKSIYSLKENSKRQETR